MPEIVKVLTHESTAIIHAIGLILVLGYPLTYYFHLRKYSTMRDIDEHRN